MVERTKPDFDLSTIGVDLSHTMDLVVAFLNIVLVDRESVYPDGF
jgi:hypothetical protein